MQLEQFMRRPERVIWLHSYALNAMESRYNGDPNESKVISFMETWAGYGYQFAMDIDFLDVLAFQRNRSKVCEFVKKRVLRFEISVHPDGLTEEEKLWTSCMQVTKPAETFSQAVRELPNRDEIMALKEILDNSSPEYVFAPDPRLHLDLKEKLGVSVHAKISEIAIVAIEREKEGDKMIEDEFSKYVDDHNEWQARIRECERMLTLQGTIREVQYQVAM